MVAVRETVLFRVELVLHAPQEALAAFSIIPLIETLHECVFVVVHACYPRLRNNPIVECLLYLCSEFSNFHTRRYNRCSMPSISRLIDRLVARIDRYQRSHRSAAFVVAVIKKYNDDEAGHRAALLAYYGFLSIFPLLLVLTTIFKLLLHNNSELGNEIIHAAVTYFPTIGRELQQNIHAISRTGAALAIGILLTLYGARGVADILRNSLDHIWQIPHSRRTTFPASLFRSMAILIVGGLSLAFAPVASGYAIVFGHNWFSGLVSALVIAGALFWVIIYVVKVGASVYRPFRDIWLGAFLAAVSLEILQSLGGFIVARELQRLDSLYGTFAIVLGLIFWIYLQTQVLLFAFEIDSVRVFKLAPRGLREPLTAADRTAYRLYADRALFHDTIDS